jgi:hypothetical protein
MSRRLIGSGFLLSLAAVAGPSASQGAEPASRPPLASSVDLDAFDCRTLLQMEGDNRNNAILFLHGYVSGQMRQTKIELGPMAEATDRIIDQCIDKPSDNALAVFARNHR